MISYPVGAVITIFAVRFIPDTVKLCSADAEPKHELNAVKDPEEVTIVGNAIEHAKLIPLGAFK